MANNTLLASDNFQRVDENPLSDSGKWTAIFGDAAGQIVSHFVEPVLTSVEYGQFRNDVTWPNDQASEVTIQNLTAEVATLVGLIVRQSASANTRYQLNLVNGSATLYKVVAGAATQLATVAGQTYTTGDVFTLQAAGSCISFWKNGGQIGYFDDASITSGSAGFLQQSNTAIANTRVQSWRGYSAIQSDGIWQKQGIVIPALAGDLDATFNGTANPSNILHEGNAQILSGTVYKMWFSGGQNIFYAESLDGISWTRHSPAVLSGKGFPSVIKNGSTYYLYCQGATDFTTFDLYTGTDGISWSLQSSTVLVRGAGGSWDDTAIVYFTPVYIDGGGTWHALYTGATGANPVYKTGLATSADGITWTKYGSNPVASNFWGMHPVLVGSTWYAWGQTNQPGQGSTQSNLDPTETLRMQSTDLITWTNPVRSIHHSEMFEGVNTNTGQAIAPFVIDISGKAHLYYTGSPNDAIAPQVFQIALAIAPVPIASIITAQEDAVLQTASDNFQRADGTLGANWTAPTGTTALQIASHLVEPSATSLTCAAVYTGVAFSNDQYSEVTLTTLTASTSFLVPLLRSSTGVRTWYELDMQGPTNTLNAFFRIFKRVSNVATQIGPAVHITPQVGDIIRFVVIGNVLSAYQNGSLLLQVIDTSSAITSGSPGFALFDSINITHDQISLWVGGNANIMPFATVSGSTGVAGATVSYTGTASGSTTADGSGNYSLIGLLNGPYTITPTLAGYTFNPVSSAQTVSGADITGVNFTATQVVTVYSVPDCRVPPAGPNASRTIQGTKIYDVQTSSNLAIPPKDSRAAGAPIDSRVSPNIPQNSRTPGTFGPGVN